ncbi:hypothetical protein [Ramlibacter sp.]|uniref:hypothetical protein n=1 Tax=Ramlibacter sp. TaxID=1917967 RepID=UPI0035AF1533
MDIVAHGLWVGMGLAAAARHRAIARRTAAWTVGLALAPDLVQMLPLLAVALQPGGLGVLKDFALAVPGAEPALPAWVAMVSHHLHCTLHSAVVAAVVTGLSIWRLRAVWLPLWGWWSHIVIDVFTHSARFYPVPVLYPLSDAAFDGIAWNTPWFLLVNYLALLVAGAALWFTRRRRMEDG